MNRVITPGDELEAQPAKQLAVAAATQSIYTHWIGLCKLTQRKRRSWLGRDTHTATQMHCRLAVMILYQWLLQKRN
jgi:hypothetical protein